MFFWVLQILIWFLVFLIAYTYLIYPYLLGIWAKKKLNNNILATESCICTPSQIPSVVVIMAVYNEEKVIEQKLKSIFETNYPSTHFKVYIGSDNSTDNTHNIIHNFLKNNELYSSNICFKIFEHRTGKIGIINNLVEIALKNAKNNLLNTVLFLTDANVFFTPNLFFEVGKHFNNEEIGLVAANILNTKILKFGISFQEQWYIQRENNIKYYEGLLWGAVMGAFGGGYALRATCWGSGVPPNFIADDFYITLQTIVLYQKKAILEPKAICYEDVPNQTRIEFLRKQRIAIGNFQNLHFFRHIFGISALKKQFSVAFAFFSHKILRWLTPFFIVAIMIIAGFLAFSGSAFYLFFVCCGLLFLLFIPFLNFFLAKYFKIEVRLFRFIAYFNAMNLALLLGFFKYIKGVKNNIWQPTQR